MGEDKIDSDLASPEPEQGLPEDGFPGLVPGEDMDIDGAGAGMRTLGVERLVQLGFVSAALLMAWLFTNIISTVWYFFADPDESLVTAGGVLLGLGVSIALYRHAAVHTLATEVASELSQVTWPTRKETSSSTVVVIVFSMIAAAMLGFFDAIWSAATDLVYKV